MKQALILAAGSGRRLAAASNGAPKCLIRVGGTTLLERQIDILRSVGIERIGVVVGHRAEEIRTAVADTCTFILNDRFAESNSLYSLWAARRWITGPFVLMNCDVLAHPDIYHRVMAVNGNALAYDSASGDDDEHMKVALQGTHVLRLCKRLDESEVDGENVGILQFDHAGAARLFEIAGEMVAAGQLNDWAPAAVARLAAEVPVRGTDITGLPWAEIDFPADLHAAEQSVCPAIEFGRWIGPDHRRASLHTRAS